MVTFEEILVDLNAILAQISANPVNFTMTTGELAGHVRLSHYILEVSMILTEFSAAKEEVMQECTQLRESGEKQDLDKLQTLWVDSLARYRALLSSIRDKFFFYWLHHHERIKEKSYGEGVSGDVNLFICLMRMEYHAKRHLFSTRITLDDFPEICSMGIYFEDTSKPLFSYTVGEYVELIERIGRMWSRLAFSEEWHDLFYHFYCVACTFISTTIDEKKANVEKYCIEHGSVKGQYKYTIKFVRHVSSMLNFFMNTDLWTNIVLRRLKDSTSPIVASPQEEVYEHFEGMSKALDDVLRAFATKSNAETLSKEVNRLMRRMFYAPGARSKYNDEAKNYTDDDGVVMGYFYPHYFNLLMEFVGEEAEDVWENNHPAYTAARTAFTFVTADIQFEDLFPKEGYFLRHCVLFYYQLDEKASLTLGGFLPVIIQLYSLCVYDKFDETLYVCNTPIDAITTWGCCLVKHKHQYRKMDEFKQIIVFMEGLQQTIEESLSSSSSSSSSTMQFSDIDTRQTPEVKQIKKKLEAWEISSKRRERMFAKK